MKESGKPTANWNPWHGCRKFSPGCRHCYMYRTDERYGRDPSLIAKTQDFSLPVKKDRAGNWKLPSGTLVWTCFTSDFLLEDADAWRQEAWAMMHMRPDLSFFFITKRIHRLIQCLPPDWGAGYKNVHIACTVEDQERADCRLPLFQQAPVCQKTIVCSPLLEELDLTPYLGPWVEQVVAGGESGPEARICKFDWIRSLRAQCEQAGVAFRFQQTGAFFFKEGKYYHIPRKFQHLQARRANIDYRPDSPAARRET